MTQQELFAAALGLDSPWKIEKILFSMAKKRLDIHIDFERGGLLPLPHMRDPLQSLRHYGG